MARLGCTKCKSVFQDVIRVRRCPLCGNTEFKDTDAEFSMEIKSFPRWFTFQGTLGYAYYQTMRIDKAAEV